MLSCSFFFFTTETGRQAALRAWVPPGRSRNEVLDRLSARRSGHKEAQRVHRCGFQDLSGSKGSSTVRGVWRRARRNVCLLAVDGSDGSGTEAAEETRRKVGDRSRRRIGETFISADAAMPGRNLGRNRPFRLEWSNIPGNRGTGTDALLKKLEALAPIERRT